MAAGIIRDAIKPNKVKLVLKCVFVKTVSVEGERKRKEVVQYFSTEVYVVDTSTNINEMLKKMEAKILEELHTFQNNGSGWRFERVVQ